MIDYFRQLPLHARLVAATLLGLAALVLFYVLAALLGWYLEADGQVRDLEPRIARMQGYTQSEEQLRDSVQALREQLADVAYPATEDSATVGAALQQQLRQSLEAAGVRVSGSQLLAPRPYDGFEEVRVSLNGSGSMEALDQALRDLQQARPLLIVRELSLNPERARRSSGGQVLILSLNVSAIRLR